MVGFKNKSPEPKPKKPVRKVFYRDHKDNVLMVRSDDPEMAYFYVGMDRGWTDVLQFRFKESNIIVTIPGHRILEVRTLDGKEYYINLASGDTDDEL